MDWWMDWMVDWIVDESLTMGDIHHRRTYFPRPNSCQLHRRTYCPATNAALIAPDPIRACNGCLLVRTFYDAQTFVKEIAVLAFCARVLVT